MLRRRRKKKPERRNKHSEMPKKPLPNKQLLQPNLLVQISRNNLISTPNNWLMRKLREPKHPSHWSSSSKARLTHCKENTIFNKKKRKHSLKQKKQLN